MDPKTLFPVGTRIVSVRSVPSPGRGAYVAPAVYEVRARKDGTPTWRLVARPLGSFYKHDRRIETGFRSVAKAERYAEAYAETHGIAFVPGVRHGLHV